MVTDHTGVIATTLPPASLPTAVNCCVVFTCRSAGFGVTVIVASAPLVTFTVAVPKIVPLVARTVLGNDPAVEPAVKTPLPETMVPPPFVTDQTGVIATTLPCASLPTAVKVCCALIAIVAGLGVTVIVASGPAVTVTVAVAVMPVQVIVMVAVPGVAPAV